MPAWVLWFSGAVVLSIAELLGGEFVLLMLGGGALVTALTALFVPWFWLQLLIFALVSIALVVGLRPTLLRHFRRAPSIRTGIDALIGSKAVVVSTVDATGGQVKVGGEVWTAKGVDGDRPLPPGTSVTVVEIRGATAVVIWRP